MGKLIFLKCYLLFFLSWAAYSAAPSVEQVFANTVSSRGDEYRTAVKAALGNPNAEANSENLLTKVPLGSEHARQARILLARIRHPEVFIELENLVYKWREEEKLYSTNELIRPGVFSGRLYEFTKRGPETEFVYEMEKDADGRVMFTTHSSRSTNSTLLVKRPTQQKIEKYSSSEVEDGIVRNNASRQAVLEHFLKFLDEGSAYEQSEFVKIVGWLWGWVASGSADALIVTDNVPDADALVFAVFQDKTRPELVRMSAAKIIVDTQPAEVQAFMLNIATSQVPEDVSNIQWSILHDSLYILGVYGDTNALAVLKSHTNAPIWKLEKIEKTVQALEKRLNSSIVK